MITFAKTIIIHAPPQKVFAVLADLTQFTKHEKGCNGVEILSKHSQGVGVHTRWTMERDHGVVTWEEKVTHYEPGRLFRFEIITPQYKAEGWHKLTPLQNGQATQLEFGKHFHYSISQEFVDTTYTDMLEKIKRASEK